MPILEQDDVEVARLAPLYQAKLSGSNQGQVDEFEERAPVISLDQLDEKGRELCKDFERNLLHQYSGPGAWAEVIRRLAHIRRRLNNEMYNQVIAFKPAIQDPPAWEALLKQTWIRRRAEDYVTLHDVVSDLVKLYIWPLRDPTGDYRRELSKQAIRLYDDQVVAYQTELDELRKKFQAQATNASDASGDRSQELPATMRNILEINRRIWVLEAERLYYQLDADLTKGYETFREKFDRADQESRMAIQPMLLLEIQGFLKRFPVGKPKYYEIRLREAQVAIDDGNAEEAEQILIELLNNYRTPEQQYKLLKLQGNTYIRIPGCSDQAFDAFNRALELTRKHGELKDRQGEALMEIGWAYRQLGQLKEAVQYYKGAQTVTPLADRTLRAQVETNLAYVEALTGNYVAAETLIRDALITRRRQNNPELIGFSLSTQGEVYRYQKKFAEAYQAYREAIAIFTEAQNSAWLGQVQQQMAIALIQDPKPNHEEAKYYIDSALHLCRE
ncbi:MAG: tetratricopeptide repeat protein, partial [Nitrososphaera sp.]|nr:tetratricopeptide repeat protein [Nitrososphaera sp.]